MCSSPISQCVSDEVTNLIVWPTNMRNSKRLLPGIALILGLLVVAPTARAVVFTSDGTTPTSLLNWNTSELIGDEVIVETGTVDGATAFLVYWNGGTSGLTAQSIDKFWYDYSCTAGSYDSTTEACSWTVDAPVTNGNPANRTPYDDLTGSPGAVADVYLYDSSAGMSTLIITDEWDLNDGSVLHADGFDMIFPSGRSQTSGMSGHPGGEDMDNALLFVLAGVVDYSSLMFAVHVPYGNDCSGYASNAELKDGMDPESNGSCVVAPEPSSVALLGAALFALASLGAWRKRRVSASG